MRCPNCGQENPDAARFCFSCGQPFEEADIREERKVVTVLFADLVGFTSRAEQMDPEDVRALLAPYHRRLRSELERFGGTVEKFIGDAVVALFGAPVAHEDDPERAVRAALAIRDWVREEDADLQLRIAVNTGEALIALGARPEAGEGMASGDVVNTTARLQAAAPVNGILVGETTWRATRDRIDYAAHDPVSAKGKSEPINVWEAVQAKSRLGMDLEQRVLTPLVGRDRELGTVFDAFDRAVGQRVPQLVTLVGVPGIGKSRLLAELFQRIEEMTEIIHWRQGRALPYGSGVSFWAFGEMVKAQAGVNENDAPDAATAKLRESVEHAVDEHERDWVQRHLQTLLGLSDDAALDRQEAFAAWRRYLEGVADERPLVLVFEDLHWADDGLLDFVDHLAEWASGVPLLVLASARPELLDRRPNWGGGKLNAVTLALSPLDDVDAARVIAAVLDQAVLPAETQTALLEQAGGNPLYAEQFARLYLEDRNVVVPENVQGIIAARLDALPDEEKRLLQDAAVLGKVFWTGGLAGSDGSALHSLERKGFIRRERRSAVAGETEYAFRHVLVREVAYGQVPRATRAGKHIAAAEWTESLGRPDDHAELIAYHYSRALDLLKAAGGTSDPALRDRARHAFRRAGDRAAALNAFGPAVEHYGAAVALWPAEDDDRARLEYQLARAEFLSGRDVGDALALAAETLLDHDVEAAATAFSLASEAAWHKGLREETDRYLERALDLVEPLPASEAKAWILSRASRNAILSTETELGLERGRRALELATALDLPEVRAHALNNLGAGQQGTLESLALLEESIDLSARLNSPEEARGHHNLAVCAYMVGDVRQALRHVELAIARAERYGLVPLWRFSRTQLPSYYVRVGRWDDALELASSVLAEGHGPSDSVRLMRAWVRVLRGQVAEAIEDAETALAEARRVALPQGMYPALAVTAFVHAEAGNAQTATALLRELADVWSEHEGAYAAPADMAVAWLELLGVELWRTKYDRPGVPQTAWLEAARALADDDFRRAIAIYERTGATADTAAAHLYAARRLVAAGNRAEADRYLQPALAFYRSVGATPRVREAEELLQASA
jgi:class 3 adenylate cyclase/predicted ATPase